MFWVKRKLYINNSTTDNYICFTDPVLMIQKHEDFNSDSENTDGHWSGLSAPSWLVRSYSPVLSLLRRWTNQGSSCRPGTITSTKQPMRRWETQKLHVIKVSSGDLKLQSVDWMTELNLWLDSGAGGVPGVHGGAGDAAGRREELHPAADAADSGVWDGARQHYRPTGPAARRGEDLPQGHHRWTAGELTWVPAGV